MVAPTSRQNQVPAWQPGDIADIPLERIAEFPLLAAVLDVWEASAADRMPPTIDPTVLPRAIVKGVNLFDIDPVTRDARIRLSGGLVTRFIGREMRGEMTASIYVGSDLEAVQRSTKAAMTSRRPSLARRKLIDSRGRLWAYFRLLLPLSSDGSQADRFATVIDPATFGRLEPDRPPVSAKD